MHPASNIRFNTPQGAVPWGSYILSKRIALADGVDATLAWQIRHIFTHTYKKNRTVSILTVRLIL
jgi:hypothetical protein